MIQTLVSHGEAVTFEELDQLLIRGSFGVEPDDQDEARIFWLGKLRRILDCMVENGFVSNENGLFSA